MATTAQVIACVLAALSGSLMAIAFGRERLAHQRKHRAKASVRGRGDALGGVESGSARASPVAHALERESRTAHPRWLSRFSRIRVWQPGLKDGRTLIARAGLSGSVTVAGLRVARVKFSAVSAVAGFGVGSLFSVEFALVSGFCGFLAGYCVVPLTLRSRAAERNADMERHLSEMVEVVVLGLHSGLSFERSFMLYPQYFSTELGESMARVAEQWGMGLVAREDALRALEAEYDSALLSRVIGSMVRSLRFGTSIAESLESAAVEAREVHRARMEERVAKVAVKMMLPVGTLILPAMLLLVLGPVMLELIEGF